MQIAESEIILVRSSKTGEKDIAVEASVYQGLLAIHPNVKYDEDSKSYKEGEGYALTHIPTGCSVTTTSLTRKSKANTKFSLVKFARYILESGIDLEWSDPEDIPRSLGKLFTNYQNGDIC